MAEASSAAGSVELRGVSKHYDIAGGRRICAAHDVTLTVKSGEFVGLTGESGAGKTTLLNLIGAVDAPDTGTIVSGGTDIAALPGTATARYRRRVGFVFQRCTLLPALTALDNVVAPVLPLRTGWDKRARAADLLAAVGLRGRERSLPSQLSGGEKQRVAIARALINTPALLLADEPAGNLDARNADEILDLLVSLRIDHSMTVLLASHDPRIAARCERLVRLASGRITEDILLTGGEGADAASIMRRIGTFG